MRAMSHNIYSKLKVQNAKFRDKSARVVRETCLSNFKLRHFEFQTVLFLADNCQLRTNNFPLYRYESGFKYAFGSATGISAFLQFTLEENFCTRTPSVANTAKCK